MSGFLPSAIKRLSVMNEEKHGSFSHSFNSIRPLVMPTKEEPKPSKKETEKKVKKISREDADEVTAFIESEPSKKEVHEYFKMKIDKLNEL